MLKNCLIAREDSKKTSSRVGEEFEIREESREQSAVHNWSAVHKSLRADSLQFYLFLHFNNCVAKQKFN